MLVVMQFRKLRGPFCRYCGLAFTRQLSAQTLLGGWWGPASMFITPIVLIHNAILLRIFAGMPEPQGPMPGRAPIDPGPPLTRRPQIFMLAIPVALMLAIVVSNLVA